MSERRYIDADALYEMARTNPNYKDFCRSQADLTSLRELLDEYPAADVEPVVRDACGWCENEECAASGGDYHRNPPCRKCIYNLKDHEYCPKCGRKLHMERSGSGERER